MNAWCSRHGLASALFSMMQGGCYCCPSVEIRQLQHRELRQVGKVVQAGRRAGGEVRKTGAHIFASSQAIKAFSKHPDFSDQNSMDTSELPQWELRGPECLELGGVEGEGGGAELRGWGWAVGGWLNGGRQHGCSPAVIGIPLRFLYGRSVPVLSTALFLEQGGLFMWAPWEIRHVQAAHHMSLFPAGWWKTPVRFLALENNLLKKTTKNNLTVFFPPWFSKACMFSVHYRHMQEAKKSSGALGQLSSLGVCGETSCALGGEHPMSWPSGPWEKAAGGAWAGWHCPMSRSVHKSFSAGV